MTSPQHLACSALPVVSLPAWYTRWSTESSYINQWHFKEKLGIYEKNNKLQQGLCQSWAFNPSNHSTFWNTSTIVYIFGWWLWNSITLPIAPATQSYLSWFHGNWTSKPSNLSPTPELLLSLPRLPSSTTPMSHYPMPHSWDDLINLINEMILYPTPAGLLSRGKKQ